MAFHARCLIMLPVFLAIGLWTGTTHALAPESSEPPESGEIGCQNEEPLLTSSWEGTLPESGVIGVWRIPLSPKHPEIVTEARLLLEWDSSQRIRATFSFPDPLPYGIPFSFQKVALSWEDGTVSGRRLIDWSEDCSGAGRSLFPGQSWGAVLDAAVPRPIKKISVRLWGARN